jgi:hypothetical protein
MDHIEAFVREKENDTAAMEIREELEQVMCVLGKPPRSLRQYRDIVVTVKPNTCRPPTRAHPGHGKRYRSKKQRRRTGTTTNA